MLAKTKAVIETAIELDSMVTSEQKEELLSVLGGDSDKRPKPIPIPTKEAARRLGVCPVTVRRYGESGLLHPIRYTARRIRWDRNEIEMFRDNGLGGAA